ncbi:MAG: hopanoid biosynthesis protein HpnM [Alphaproteobacteria bacterium]|nr:hopanoid biosynthesis protein HpnM [Alphaproteobacteria bacterium]
MRRMMAKHLVAMAMALFATLSFPTARAADAADPAAAQIESFYATLIDTMKKGGELGLQGRFKALGPATEDAFDLPTMAQLTVGPSWQMVSEADRAAVVEAFERLTLANYAKNFATFGGEKFTVDPNVKMRGEDKIVETKLVESDGKATAFNYRLHMAGGKWKVIDVYLNGYVSQLALRRSDFSSTVARGGAAELVKKINVLVDRQMSGR